MPASIPLLAIGLLASFSCLVPASIREAQATAAPMVGWEDIAVEDLPATVNIQVSKVALQDTDPAGGQSAPGERNEFVGSGFIVDPSGIIVTNKHVIDGALSISVTLQDGTEAYASVLGGASFIDLALLKIDVGHPLPTLKLGNSDAVKPGNPVLAIGDPLGVGTSLSAGIVSGTEPDLMNTPFDDYIQTDAAINHGNSGGPLVDRSGNVIGVNSILFTNHANEGSNGVGFAISSNVLAIVLQHLLHPPVRFGWIGVHLQGMTPDLSRALDAPRYGAIVTEVETQSAASDAGLKTGDVIVDLDGKRAPNARALVTLISITPIGTTRVLKVWSAGKVRDVPVTVRAWQGATGLATVNLQNQRCLPRPDQNLGLLLEPITPFERQIHDLGDQSGLVVVAVDPTSEAYGRGFRPGVVIEQINGQAVLTKDAADQILKDAAAHSSLVALLVQGSKGPSWFTLHTSYDAGHDALDTSGAQLSALCAPAADASLSPAAQQRVQP